MSAAAQHRRALQTFYKKVFPAAAVYRLLSQCMALDDELDTVDNMALATRCRSWWQRREFSIATAHGHYIRYLRFDTPGDLVAYLAAEGPVRVHLGPVYACALSRRNGVRPPAGDPAHDAKAVRFDAAAQLSVVEKPSAKLAVARELVFDMDLTDWSPQMRRHCGCGGQKSVCNSCWLIMVGAVRLLHTCLTDLCGFADVLWSFSGGRGVHAWVLDWEATMRVQIEGRQAIVDHINACFEWAKVDPPPAGQSIPLGMRTWNDAMLHTLDGDVWPHVRDHVVPALELWNVAPLRTVLHELGEEHVKALAMRGLSGGYADMDPGLYYAMCKLVRTRRRAPNGNMTLPPVFDRALWTQVCEQVFDRHIGLRRWLAATVCAPRLDEPVTTGSNHLIRSPFSIHQSSFRQSRPFSTGATTCAEMRAATRDIDVAFPVLPADADDADARALQWARVRKAQRRGLDVVEQCVRAYRHRSAADEAADERACGSLPGGTVFDTWTPTF